MPKLTIGRMAKLYGLHRSTLHEAVRKGRVSFEIDRQGGRLIDLSEMIRVYGEPTAPLQTLHTEDRQISIGIEELLNEVKALRSEVSNLRGQLLRIEYKPKPDRSSARTFADLLDVFS